MYLNPYIEFLVRFATFRLGVQELRQKYLLKKPKKKSKISLKQIEEAFINYGIKKGDNIIVHSSLSYIDAKAHEVVQFLQSYIGPEGNVLMPSHPILSIDENGMEVYDVKKSKSNVGYLSDYFKNCEGVKRSLHPYSSVAVWGKDRDWYLENNLNEHLPLPHGKYSPYYKLAQKNGIAICIGVTAKDRGTIKHVPEEVLDEKFPIKNLFETNKVKIIDQDKEFISTVRRAKLKFSQLYIAKHKIRKEWLENNILKEYSYDNVPVHFIDCKRGVDYMIEQIRLGNTSYPLASKS